ncbi:hypothetical protein OG879_13505 [Streptomyces caniferus]|uniref:hypothetical protein n=1 Tax=Streptomyces caniferus TaxID=285557 RepID=UPI002E2D160D|nr:hypothetical protein [Streptomyces caniferus]
MPVPAAFSALLPAFGGGDVLPAHPASALRDPTHVPQGGTQLLSEEAELPIRRATVPEEVGRVIEQPVRHIEWHILDTVRDTGEAALTSAIAHEEAGLSVRTHPRQQARGP